MSARFYFMSRLVPGMIVKRALDGAGAGNPQPGRLRWALSVPAGIFMGPRSQPATDVYGVDAGYTDQRLITVFGIGGAGFHERHASHCPG